MVCSWIVARTNGDEMSWQLRVKANEIVSSSPGGVTFYSLYLALPQL